MPSAALLRPAGMGPAEPSDLSADLFFVHPTSFFDLAPGNGAVDYARAVGLTRALSLAYQASAFNRHCRIFAPRYRQASLGCYLGFPPEGFAALDVAYGDVRLAFDAFLYASGDSRPIVLAGHSQGSQHLLRLIADCIDPDPALRARLVAAFPLGYDLPVDYFERRVRHIGRGVLSGGLPDIVTWSTFSRGGLDATQGSQYAHWYAGGWETNDGKPLWCLNPLDWAARGYVSADRHLGGLPITLDLSTETLTTVDKVIPERSLPHLIPNLCGAEVVTGRLAIDVPIASGFDRLRFGESNYHIYDFPLFYENLNTILSMKLEDQRRKRNRL